MDDDAFRELVKRMRQKQRDYFRSRDATVLSECKDLERRVDDELSRDRAPALFE